MIFTLLIRQIVKHDSNEVAILETKEDHPSDQRKVFQDLDHVIELYDFPSSFKTCDIVQLYNELQCDTMYIKWVNDTHALLVLSTPTQGNELPSRPVDQHLSLWCFSAKSTSDTKWPGQIAAHAGSKRAVPVRCSQTQPEAGHEAAADQLADCEEDDHHTSRCKKHHQQGDAGARTEAPERRQRLVSSC